MFQLWLYLLPEQTCSILGDLTTFAGWSKVGLLIIYCYLSKKLYKNMSLIRCAAPAKLKLGFWPYLPLQANFLEFRVWSHLRPLENLVKVVVFLTLAPWVNMLKGKSLIAFAIQTIRFADKHLIILTTLNPKICYGKFLERYTKTYKKHFPLKKLKHRLHPRRPWISQGLLKSTKKKNKLYKRYLFKSFSSEGTDI